VQQESEIHKTPDIYTIFIYRYIFDRKNDIVDLRADVYDLQHFPERLMSSYQAEWKKYNKKAANERGIDIEQQDTSALIDTMRSDQQQELAEFLKIIENTITINESKNIKVIKTELKTYIETLIKL
jgi:hypothetical protein